MERDFLCVKKIFEKYKVINVPYYQRDYVWGQKNSGQNLYKFIDDIFTQYSNSAETDYFIGTLAFCAKKTFDVIDGQQRLTSLVLILSLLSELKCSQEIKDACHKLLLPEGEGGRFVIQEEHYLTQEIKYNLGLENNFNSQGYSVDISKTKDRITQQITMYWSGHPVQWYNGLYNYILDKVNFISLEYTNIPDSLKYFLNINSLSIQLTQSDIFFSILSQSLRISKSGQDIFAIKENVSRLACFLGITKKLDKDKYDCYDDTQSGVDNVIFIFLASYFQNDRNIMMLKTTGVGKWLSLYKNNIFTDQLDAKEFVENFITYLKDFKAVYCYFANQSTHLEPSCSLYFSFILLQYESYADILEMLYILFKLRHNYIKGANTLYEEGTKTISKQKLNEIAKRLCLTLIWNYIRSCNRRLDLFETNIKIKETGEYEKSTNDIILDMTLDEMFNLTYNDKKGFSNSKIKDESRLIKVIFAVQEAFLDWTADKTKDMAEYLGSILTKNNFSIEHLYSIKEYSNKERLKNWQQKKSIFFDDTEFDSHRCSFDNLSLLDSPSNAAANDQEIKDKFICYKNARKVCESHWEYLIQSLVDSSEYYKNENITALNLPERKLQNIDQNTWEHSACNRDFNTKLMRLAIQEIAKETQKE